MLKNATIAAWENVGLQIKGEKPIEYHGFGKRENKCWLLSTGNLTNLVFNNAIKSGNEGKALEDSNSTFEFSSEFKTFGFPFESNGAEMSSSIIESGRKILMYITATTATDVAT